MVCVNRGTVAQYLFNLYFTCFLSIQNRWKATSILKEQEHTFKKASIHFFQLKVPTSNRFSTLSWLSFTNTFSHQDETCTPASPNVMCYLIKMRAVLFSSVWKQLMIIRCSGLITHLKLPLKSFVFFLEKLWSMCSKELFWMTSCVSSLHPILKRNLPILSIAFPCHSMTLFCHIALFLLFECSHDLFSFCIIKFIFFPLSNNHVGFCCLLLPDVLNGSMK